MFRKTHTAVFLALAIAGAIGCGSLHLTIEKPAHSRAVYTPPCALEASWYDSTGVTAIVDDKATSAYGYAWGKRNVHSALKEARRNCGRFTNQYCSTLVVCEEPGWGAVALREARNGSPWSIGAVCGYDNQRAAERAALDYCEGR